VPRVGVPPSFFDKFRTTEGHSEPTLMSHIIFTSVVVAEQDLAFIISAQVGITFRVFACFFTTPLPIYNSTSGNGKYWTLKVYLEDFLFRTVLN